MSEMFSGHHLLAGALALVLVSGLPAALIATPSGALTRRDAVLVWE